MTPRFVMLSGILGGLLVGTVATTPLSAQTPTSASATLRAGEIRLTYLGNAGWEITDGKAVVLVDPFLTQFKRWPAPGTTAERVPGYDAEYGPDTALVNKHVKRADYILVTHGHSDHAMDAPYIANRTGATIIGHESAANLARAASVPDSQLITVIGGEDYEFGDFSLKVIPNIHSALDQKHYYNNGRNIAGTVPRGLTVPLKRGDYQEGGNIAYLLRMGGHEVLIMGSMNFLERELIGLRPDIALVGANSQRLEIHDFTGRLLRTLGFPALVIPTHADSYGDPSPPAAVLADRERFEQEVKDASPNSKYIYPTWFQPIVVPARTNTSTSSKQVINPPGISPLVPAYSVAIRSGDFVFVAGMTGVNPGTQDIVGGGVAAQTRQTMENIKTALQTAGAGMDDVVECTVFLKDMAHYAEMNSVYIEYFRVKPPARATLAVSTLPRPAALVEIKCSAHTPSGR